MCLGVTSAKNACRARGTSERDRVEVPTGVETSKLSGQQVVPREKAPATQRVSEASQDNYTIVIRWKRLVIMHAECVDSEHNQGSASLVA